ncbi:MAG: HDOD domain-containing protein [Gammaproteobacteria bacterium]|nr:HDOD domain-containing protein [Gammaproteobacteria bacterium]
MAYDAASLVASASEFAILPTVYFKVDEAINDPCKSNHHLSQIINEDAVLAAKLLRIANSALFNFPSRIDTISRAITVIGTQQLRDMVLSCSVIKTFNHLPADLVDMDSFWRHSMATAVAARLLATYCKELNVERYFVAGLLHDIGQLVLFSEIPDLICEVIQKARSMQLLLQDVELEMVGFTHADVGALLMKLWKLPECLEEVVGHHHVPASAKVSIKEVAIVHVADLMTTALQLGRSGEFYAPELNNEAWQSLGLSANVIPLIIQQLERQYQDAIRYILSD